MQISHFEMIKFNILSVNYYRLGGKLEKRVEEEEKKYFNKKASNPNLEKITCHQYHILKYRTSQFI